jgi:hypothetical protein
MTTTINASTSSGLVQTADTSGIIKVQSNGVTTNALAWVNFNGTSATPITPRANYNVSSVTKNSTGDYTLNFTNALTDANYAIIGSAQGLSTNDSTFQINGTFNSTTTSYLTTACRVYVGNSGGALDCTVVNAVVFGN